MSACLLSRPLSTRASVPYWLIDASTVHLITTSRSPAGPAWHWFTDLMASRPSLLVENAAAICAILSVPIQVAAAPAEGQAPPLDYFDAPSPGEGTLHGLQGVAVTAATGFFTRIAAGTA